MQSGSWSHSILKKLKPGLDSLQLIENRHLEDGVNQTSTLSS